MTDKDKLIAELKAENARLKEENYQLQKDCQICENFIDFIPCKPIRDMDYDLQKVIGQRDDYYQTLQEIKAIAVDTRDCKQYEIDHDCFNETRCKALRELIETLQEIIDLITKAEEE